MRPVIFLHIPKVGGTTLRAVLRRWHPPAEIREFDMEPCEVKLAALRAQPGVRLVLSHGPFGLHEAFAEPVHYITLLREPVERIVSHFYYVLRTPHHFQHESLRRGDVTLLALARRVANLQTRWLAGKDEDSNPDRTLEQAKENVTRHFTVAGITERFPESVLLVHRIFGRKLRPFTSENVASQRTPLASFSSSELQALRAAMELDCEIYDFVCRRFEEQVAQQGPAFARQVTNLHRGNRVAEFAARMRRLCFRAKV